ncbi:MAG: hypothetical protein ACYDGN_13500 [Acidimicrobiales bacterium]
MATRPTGLPSLSRMRACTPSVPAGPNLSSSWRYTTWGSVSVVVPDTCNVSIDRGRHVSGRHVVHAEIDEGRWGDTVAIREDWRPGNTWEPAAPRG